MKKGSNINWDHNMRHQNYPFLKGNILVMLNKRTFKKHCYFPELFIGTTADKYLKQYQIELNANSLLGINIVQIK